MKKAECICFGSVGNEYLITEWGGIFLPFLKFTLVERSIGVIGRDLSKEAAKLLRKGVETRVCYMTLQEFDKYATNHPVLAYDPWVKKRQQTKSSGAVRR